VRRQTRAGQQFHDPLTRRPFERQHGGLS
jgi:hypothetical protein